MTLTCYRCDRKVAVGGGIRRLLATAAHFGWRWIDGRQHCPSCVLLCEAA